MVKVTSELARFWRESTDFVTAGSASVPPGTVVSTKAVLFSSFGSVAPKSGSGGVLTCTTLVMMVPGSAPRSTWTTTVKTSSASSGTLLSVQVRVLLLACGSGGAQVQLAGEVAETKVVPAGTRSFRVAITEAS